MCKNTYSCQLCLNIIGKQCFNEEEYRELFVLALLFLINLKRSETTLPLGLTLSMNNSLTDDYMNTSNRFIVENVHLYIRLNNYFFCFLSIKTDIDLLTVEA